MTPVPLQSTTPAATASPLVAGSPAFDPDYKVEAGSSGTVNSEIFARVLFSRNFAYAKFRENKVSRNAEITLSFTNIRRSWPLRDF